MYISIKTELAEVELSDEVEGYTPDVMDDLCRRAVRATLELHLLLAGLEVEAGD